MEAMQIREEAERRLVALELKDLEMHARGLEDRLRSTSCAEVQAKIASWELKDLESKVDDARAAQCAAERTYHAHLAVLARSLSSLEVEQLSSMATPLSNMLAPGELSDLRDAVSALEYLLDANSPPPVGPIPAAPDQLCAVLLEEALAPLLRTTDNQNPLLIARAIRALGQRAGGVTIAMSELAALLAILEGEIQLMDQGPLIPAGGAGG